MRDINDAAKAFVLGVLTVAVGVKTALVISWLGFDSRNAMYYYAIGACISVIVEVGLILKDRKKPKDPDPLLEEIHAMPYYKSLRLLSDIGSYTAIVGFALYDETILALGYAVSKLFELYGPNQRRVAK